MTASTDTTTAGMIHRLRGPASHVIVDVIDPGAGSTPVRQALVAMAARPTKPSATPTTLLSAGIVVGATVVSAGIVNLAPAFAALAFAAAVVIGERVVQRRARRTSHDTPWASLSGQAFGAWEPNAPDGRCRLLVDQRGLAVAELGTKRRPQAVILWNRVARMVVVPGRERSTDPGIVIHRADGRAAVFLSSINTHEVLHALDEVGVLTDIEQVMTGATAVHRSSPATAPTRAPAEGRKASNGHAATATPAIPAAPTSAPPDAWSRLTPPPPRR